MDYEAISGAVGGDPVRADAGAGVRGPGAGGREVVMSDEDGQRVAVATVDWHVRKKG